MDQLLNRAVELQSAIRAALEKLRIKDVGAQLGRLKATSAAPEFWQNNEKAQNVMKQITKLESRVVPWEDLELQVNDLVTLIKIDDNSLRSDLEVQLDKTQAKFQELKEQLKFSGQYDDHAAILNIHAGAGGTDAQDWAQMLLRMYVRWAEGQGYKVKTIDESAGEEAGIKSATLEIDGHFAYGKLRGERGVHRLVRLSPFNADNLRQTSFAKVEASPKIDQPDEVQIDDKDLKVDVYRSSGKGGQSVNTTDSAVRVTHVPTGIVVAIQNERSQLQNKETALTILRSKLAQLQMEQHAEKLSELKGPNEQAAWGNQIRSYVLHPYKQVKDLRTRYESGDPDKVLDGALDPLINAYLEHLLGKGIYDDNQS